MPSGNDSQRAKRAFSTVCAACSWQVQSTDRRVGELFANFPGPLPDSSDLTGQPAVYGLSIGPGKLKPRRLRCCRSWQLQDCAATLLTGQAGADKVRSRVLVGPGCCRRQQPCDCSKVCHSRSPFATSFTSPESIVLKLDTCWLKQKISSLSAYHSRFEEVMPAKSLGLKLCLLQI